MLNYNMSKLRTNRFVICIENAKKNSSICRFSLFFVHFEKLNLFLVQLEWLIEKVRVLG
jgi:hypothetical protein